MRLRFRITKLNSNLLHLTDVRVNRCEIILEKAKILCAGSLLCLCIRQSLRAA